MTHEERIVRISPPALVLLESMPRIAGNPYVIPGRRHMSPILNYASAWGAICKAADVQDLQVRDLRRTFASVGLEAGLSLEAVGKLLGHTQAATTDGYAWLRDRSATSAADLIGAQIAALTEG